MTKKKPSITLNTQEMIERRIAAAYKAIVGQPELEVSFGANNEGSNVGLSTRLPRPKSTSIKDIEKSRGEADFLAFKHRYHNATLHAHKKPFDEDQAMLFNALEAARIEAVGSIAFKGASKNVSAALNTRYSRMDLNHSVEHLGDSAWPEALRVYARKIFADKDIPDEAKGLEDAFANKLDAQLTMQLEHLKSIIDDQKKFALESNKFLKFLNGEIPQEETKETPSQDDEEISDEDTEQSQGEADSTDKSESSRETQTDAQSGIETETMDTEGDDENEDNEDTVDTPANGKHNQTGEIEQQNIYRPYTTEFDVVETASDLSVPAELQQLRKKLDDILETYSSLISRLANRMQRKLQAQQLRAWNFDLEEGLLDTARLTRVVCNPLQSLSFKQEDNSNFKDTVVTLLIDNSGSMRGRPIALAAMASDILVRTLERCGVKVEVLGFTTVNWKGGKAMDKWADSGRPPMPGRLNDLRHIVYKSANDQYHRTKNNFGLMLREGLLKENIDGEALEWAFSRLNTRTEDRKILMVLSDGAPVDDATLSHNPNNFLERHLRDTIEKIENKDTMDLLAIGIGHDVTKYYKHAVTIPNADTLADVMMNELIALFDKKKNKRKR